MNLLPARMAAAVTAAAVVAAVGGLAGGAVPAAGAAAVRAPAPAAAPAAVKGFDEAGVSTGTGDAFTTTQWTSIASAGFKLFITDPVYWSSECSDQWCTNPVNTCTVDPAAVTQIQDAMNAGLDYAVYTRNVNCLTKAIKGLGTSLEKHLSFAVLDIETDPSVPPSAALINGVKALGVTPVIYSDQGSWVSITGNTTAYRTYPLNDGEVPNWQVSFPAPYPPGFPTLVNMPNPYGGWSGYADIEQQQCCAEIAGISNASDAVDLDAVNKAWLASLPQS
jgi:hypothetical protein